MHYGFGDYAFDDQLYQLKRNGTAIEIEPKVFDVLAYLLHNRDRIVSKDELLEKLWPGQVVSETALTRCIVAARKAVGDDGTKQEVIETQHGRGYRFVASLTTNPQPVQSSTFQVPRQEEARQKWRRQKQSER
jgi:DNA-binding winged helix-turn-helix (wHTH) protein